MLQIYSTKRLPKARFPKAAPQSCCRKLLPKVVSWMKLVPKAAVLQSCRAKMFLKAAPAPQSCSPNLPHKAVPQSRSPKLLSQAAPDSCPRKLFPKAASQSCFLKLLPKAVVLQRNCPSMLLQSHKVAPHSCFPKLYRKPRPKEAPRNSKAAPRSCLKAGPESCPSLKLFPGAAPQSCSPKLLPQSLRFCKPVRQNGSPKPFCKPAPQSCYRKLLSEVVCKAVPESFPPKLLFFKAIVRQSWPEKAGQSCSPKRFPEAASQSSSPKQRSKVTPRPKEAPLKSAHRPKKQAQCAR